MKLPSRRLNVSLAWVSLLKLAQCNAGTAATATRRQYPKPGPHSGRN